jgi:hypothetical protein
VYGAAIHHVIPTTSRSQLISVELVVKTTVFVTAATAAASRNSDVI